MRIGELQMALLRIVVGISLLIVPLAAVAQVRKPASSPSPGRTINVITEPNATIWLDGVRFGTTDKSGSFSITTVAQGVHTLRVRADGFREKSLPLTALQKGDVDVVLIKTTDGAELAYQEAERLSTADRDKSADAYRKAIKLRPNYLDAYIGLARVLSDSGDLEEAQKTIGSGRKLAGGNAEASAVEGRIYKENGEEAKATAAFKRSILEGKGFQPEAYTGLGILYKEKAEGLAGSGDFEKENTNYTEAAKNFRSAVKQLSGAPDAIVVYQLLGLVYERQKKYTEAIGVYEEF